MEILFTGNALNLGSFVYLCGLICASLFFVMVGIKALRLERYEGALYICLSAFFIGAHIVFLLTESQHSFLSNFGINLSLDQWVILMLGPSLVILFLGFGLFSMIKLDIAEAVIKIILGLGLIGILYHIGIDWPGIIKAALVMLFSIIWFTIELKTAGEME